MRNGEATAARDRICEARGKLDRAMRALCLPTADWQAASAALSEASAECGSLALECGMRAVLGSIEERKDR